ncbi:hypothetical protein ACFPRL_02275 [Pseudoclavibacter helvolus]
MCGVRCRSDAWVLHTLRPAAPQSVAATLVTAHRGRGRPRCDPARAALAPLPQRLGVDRRGARTLERPPAGVARARGSVV